MKNITFPQSKTLQPVGITLAVSTQYHAFPDRFNWIAEHGLGMAYTPDAQNLHLGRLHLQDYLDRNIPVRHHGYFPGFELGDANYQKAKISLDLHMKAVDAMSGLGEQVMTVHIGLVEAIELNPEYTKEHLCQLVDYAQNKGVTIAVENLRRGVASDPRYIANLAQKSGSAITLDVGHAVSCKMVQDGEISVVEIVDMFSHALEEVHFYEYETDAHYAPKDMSILGPIVDALLMTDCRWWTIELIKFDDIMSTVQLVKEYMAEKCAHNAFA